MKLFRHMPPDAHVAFRLPGGLLSTIDTVRDLLDLTRSQLFRRSIAEYLKAFESKASERGHEE